MAQSSKIQFGYRRHPDQDRPDGDAAHHPWWWSAPGRSGCRWRSIWRSAASPWCCSTMPTGSARARARSAFPSVRWSSGTGSASASAWSTRAWCGASAGSFTATTQLYQFNLLPEEGHKRPAFINLQQFYAEAYLVDRVGSLPAIDLRWRNKVTGARAAQRPCGADGRDAGWTLSDARRIMSWPATARGRRCGRWSARNSPARCSKTSS